MGTTRRPKTSERILDVAEKLVQVRGWNAYSYADVSKALGIRKASLHHHFATKTDLGLALLSRYRRVFLDALEGIALREEHPMERIERYIDLYRTVLRKRRMCMCGILASDIATLPEPMREGVAQFFADNETWLARTLAEGKKRGEIRFTGPAAAMATFIVSSLEGAMLVSRGRGNLDHFDDVADLLLAGLRPGRPTRAKGAAAAR